LFKKNYSLHKIAKSYILNNFQNEKMYLTFFYPCTEKIENRDYKTNSEFLYQKK
jgi:hypothetical protein